MKWGLNYPNMLHQRNCLEFTFVPTSVCQRFGLGASVTAQSFVLVAANRKRQFRLALNVLIAIFAAWKERGDSRSNSMTMSKRVRRTEDGHWHITVMRHI